MTLGNYYRSYVPTDGDFVFEARELGNRVIDCCFFASFTPSVASRRSPPFLCRKGSNLIFPHFFSQTHPNVFASQLYDCLALDIQAEPQRHPRIQGRIWVCQSQSYVNVICHVSFPPHLDVARLSILFESCPASVCPGWHYRPTSTGVRHTCLELWASRESLDSSGTQIIDRAFSC